MITLQNKHKVIAASLRGRIVSGEWRPGAQLPTRTTFERDFVASMPTVQKALNRLVRDGFVRSEHGSGTFVTDYPPHLFRCGLLFHAHHRWPGFYESLLTAAKQISRSPERRIAEYRFDDPKGLERLDHDLESQALAGVIMVHPIPDFFEHPALMNSTVPKVLIGSPPKHGIPGVGADTDLWEIRAAAHCQKQGRRRPAFIYGDVPQATFKPFVREAKRLGMEVCDHLLVPCAVVSQSRAVAHTVRLLMELGAEKRPDAIVVSDDNLVESVLSGLMSAGVKIPGEIEVVAHCNFPNPIAGNAPITRLGFDCAELIQRAMLLLQAGSLGNVEPLVKPLFENEWIRVMSPWP